MKMFIGSQFVYCLLIWMLHSRRFNNKTNRIYERAIMNCIYNDKLWSFQDFLDKDVSVMIPHSKIWNIAIQSFKFLQRLSLHKLNKVFVERGWIYSVRYGTSSVLLLTRKSLKHFAKENEGFWNVQYFQNSPRECPCRLCKSYLPQVVLKYQLAFQNYQNASKTP